jgi:hypothetical protein
MSRSPTARKTKAYATIAPKRDTSTTDIRAALKSFQGKPLTTAEADAHLAANGTPPSPAPSETWREALIADCKLVGRLAVRGVELCDHAGIAVAASVIVAMVGGIAIAVFGPTAWKFWVIANPIADELVARIIGG